MRRNNRQSGFSLLEVMVGMGLVVVLGGISTPVASEYMKSYRLVGATDRVANEIRRARMQAIGQNLFVRIRIDDNHIGREVSTDGVTFAADGPAAALPDSVSVTLGRGGSPTFNRNGIAPASSTIYLNTDEGIKSVYTNILGRVAVP